MKWTYSIRNKMAASAALFALCLLVLFSNYVDRDHTNSVKKSIRTLYEDRLVAEGFILKMTSDVYQIKEALNASESAPAIGDSGVAKLLSDIDGLSKAYLKTKLTASEDIKFTALQKVLGEIESSTLNQIHYQGENANKAICLLHELSAIQLEESKLIMDHAEGLYLSGKASSQFAYAIVLVILLVLQSLVFTSKTLTAGNQASASYLN